MLMGYTDGLSERRSSREQLLADPEVELDDDDDEAVDNSQKILYAASFDELATNYVKYDTIIWFSISLMLVLAWGIGVFMLLYLPFKRYVLQKDISSRKLYVTPTEIVYKVWKKRFVYGCEFVCFLSVRDQGNWLLNLFVYSLFLFVLKRFRGLPSYPFGA